MINSLENSWKQVLSHEFNKKYFKELESFVVSEYADNTCYPEMQNIWSAFNYCSIENVKVVIIGQDPYHGEGQANGLCFSVKDGIRHPPSLINIFKEITTDLNCTYPASGNLERWAKQGVLLLNATLTVREAQPGSHQKKGWETFTDAVIRIISESKKDVVFLLWGGYAKKKAKLVDIKKHVILESGHPSPLSANRGYWFGNRHFSICNRMLHNKNEKKIDWK
ncbi:uracil-DNA glycosylase [uncultured Maribacter sp.]|uniref:uracil-DNA glycosylase n=1 Tax=uncultured Maribacter sp. TaxID=431308 RepID=UPI00261B6624|nr:uracil-DNA glycosylase [uncultured Maribacter sp.]